jgi:hypothetical protein
MKLTKNILHYNNDNFTRLLGYLTIAVLSVCVALNLYAIADVSVWRHDELYYQPDYFHKVEAEGRWLNYLLSEYLAELPALLCIGVVYLSIFYSVAKSAWNTNRDLLIALAIALTALQFPFLSTLLFWPATTLPGFLVLFIACCLSDKIPKIVFFPIFAILFFATLNNLYFLLPLLFLRKLDARETFKLLTIWVSSFLLGFLVTQIITYNLTGHLIEVAGWRNPNPITSWEDLLQNLRRALDAWARINSTIWHMLGFFLCAMWAVMLLIGRRPQINDLCLTIVIILAAVAIFASGIPLGLGVQGRTSLTYTTGLIFLACVREDASDLTRTLILILCLSAGSTMAISNFQTIQWYAGVTNEIKEEMRRAIPGYLKDDVTIVLGISNRDWEKITRKIEICNNLTYVTGERFRGGYRVAQAVKELGYRKVAWCLPKKCEESSVKVSKSLENCERRIFEPYRHKQNEFWLFASKDYLR